MFQDFFYLLRDYGLEVSTDDYLTFLRGLERGLVGGVDELFLYARLCFVRRVEQNDAFERAFAYYFAGVDLPPVAEGDPELFQTKQFREWLRQAVARGEIQPVTHNISPTELMRRFWETVRAQMSEHHGGNRWVGTGGTSPFGHSGNATGGVRVFGTARNFSAVKTIGERRYVDYSDQHALSRGNVREALAALKHLKAHGAETELDVPETIYRTGRAGGEIELRFRREVRDRIEIALFIDNGGYSMMPHIELTRDLFAKVRGRFRRLRTFFFHNAVYDVLYTDAARTRGVPTERFLIEQNPETRVLFVGDGAMAPGELMSVYGSIEWENESPVAAIEWFRRMRARFPHSVWLNPLPREVWAGGRGPWTVQQLRQVFHMEDLSLGGIKRAVEYLMR